MSRPTRLHEAIPQGWFSWSYDLLRGDRIESEIVLESLDLGTIRHDGETFSVRRTGWTGPWVLTTKAGEPIAEAEKPSPFSYRFLTEHGESRFFFEPEGPFSRAMILYDAEDEEPVGCVEPKHMLSRNILAELPVDLSPTFRAFLVWMTLMTWRRRKQR